MTAKEKFATLSPTAQAQHMAAWSRVEALVLSLDPKQATVFEVRHALEYARKLYFAELLRDMPPDLCERAVRRAYQPES